jgi:cytochrome c biogenesis protein CcmG/thiol:disulfide interchange protein DsbE
MSDAKLAGNRVSSRRPPLLTVLPLLLFAGLAALFYVQLGGGDPSTLPSALIGKPVPDASLPALDGLARDGVAVPGLRAAELGDGRVTVVNVFSSWCGPCRDEHPVLAALAASGKARLVGIDYKDEPDNARRFLGRLGNPYDAVGVDPKGRAAIDWGVYGVPETFVVGPDGTVRFKFVGPLSEASLASKLMPQIDKARSEGSIRRPAGP